MGTHEHFGQNDARVRQALDYDDSGGAPSSTRAGMLWIPSSGKWAPREVLLASDYGAAGGVAELDGSGLLPAGRVPFGTGSAQVAAGNHNHDNTYVDFASDQNIGGTKTFTKSGSPIVPAPVAAGNPVRWDLRGPIGGVNAQTLAAGTYSIDATTFNVRRYTLTGDITLNAPTSGADGQRITFWLGASGGQRTVTFASGYEVSPLLPSRAIVVASGTWEMVEVECRNGTWRLVQTDQLLFSAADVGGLTQTTGDARYARGVVARNRRASNSSQSASTTAVGVSRLSCPVVAGRLYRVHAPALMVGATAATSALALIVLRITHTLDGSTPTTSSAVLAQDHITVPSGLTAAQPVEGFVGTLFAPTTSQTLSIQLDFARASGSQTFQIYGAQTGMPIDLIVEDLGVDPGSSGAAL